MAGEPDLDGLVAPQADAGEAAPQVAIEAHVLYEEPSARELLEGQDAIQATTECEAKVRSDAAASELPEGQDAIQATIECEANVRSDAAAPPELLPTPQTASRKAPSPIALVGDGDGDGPMAATVTAETHLEQPEEATTTIDTRMPAEAGVEKPIEVTLPEVSGAEASTNVSSGPAEARGEQPTETISSAPEELAEQPADMCAVGERGEAAQLDALALANSLQRTTTEEVPAADVDA
jgi:hypothetical protein